MKTKPEEKGWEELEEIIADYISFPLERKYWDVVGVKYARGQMKNRIEKLLSSTLQRAYERVEKMSNGIAFQLKAEMISMRILKQEFNWDESQNDAHIRIAREISKFYQAELATVIKQIMKEGVNTK